MAESEKVRWQARMAPLMSAMVVAAALFFGVVTLVQFARLEPRLAPPHPNVLAIIQDETAPAASTFSERLQLMRARASIALEQDVIAHRYEEANIAVIARLWTRFMGFLTGMILALIGAAFVLGKLNEPESSLGASGQQFALNFRSASPGLTLSVLGTVLMTISLVVPVTVGTRDIPAYFVTDFAGASAASEPMAAAATDLSMQNAPPPSKKGAAP